MDGSTRGGTVLWVVGVSFSVAMFACDEEPRCPPATICTPVGTEDGGLEPKESVDAGEPSSMGNSEPTLPGSGGGSGGQGGQTGDRDGGSAATP